MEPIKEKHKTGECIIIEKKSTYNFGAPKFFFSGIRQQIEKRQE